MPTASTVDRPTRLRLRRWQSAALDCLASSGRPDFLLVATPGAGKTTLALTAAVQDLSDHPGRRVVVVAPTRHLKHQWAEAAARLGLHLEPEWSPRDGVLPGDVHGIATTYQQVATASAPLARLSVGSFVILDEVHHAGDDRSWGSALLEAFGPAARRLSLSGTPFRSDSSAIPFVEYHLDEARPDFEYGYGDALTDGGVVRPVYFPRINGFMEWTAPDGELVAATFDDELGRERANQRLRTALSLDGQWLPTVLDQAHERLAELRREHPEAGGLVIATDREHARGIAEHLRARHRVPVVVATSDDPEASERIARFAAGTDPWIVAVRMVSEGVDIPRLRIAVYATVTTTELFFRQAVGRVVRHQRGLRRQPAYVFLPDDPRLRRHAATVAESRRHHLRNRPRSEGVGAGREEERDGDAEQMSLFSVIGAVAFDPAHPDLPAGRSLGVFDADDETAGDGDGAGGGVEVVLVPPPLPGATPTAAPGQHPGPKLGQVGPGLRARKRRLRELNADVAAELVRATGWPHARVNAELNRLVGIERISEATLVQLERRLEHGRRWLRRAG